MGDSTSESGGARTTFYVQVKGRWVPIGVVDLVTGDVLAPEETMKGGRVHVEYVHVGHLPETSLERVREGDPIAESATLPVG